MLNEPMQAKQPSRSEMERAFFARDSSYDGVFFVGVRTTRIYCRPSCAAKKPRADHAQYFASGAEAVAAGYRPCRRCRPERSLVQPPEWIGGLLSRIDGDPGRHWSDRELRALGLPPWRVRRFFRDRFGITFHAYCRARRMAGALHEIRVGADLDDVVFDTGYESHSGFRSAFAKAIGTSPGRSRTLECIDVDMVDTPLGPVVVGATPSALCLLEFATRRMLATQVDVLRRRFRSPVMPGRNDVIDQTAAELSDYFAGKRTHFDVPVAAPGTPFQERVWAAVSRIPYGATRSYEGVAVDVGRAGAVRAVGTANGANRVAIVIPCHRVCRKSGDPGGYGGGRWRKEALLELEQRHR
ncbi:MAG TPA: methylated-DNA--[protein]-cysteine S-methyltransferase [Candidatus Krumholzibacteria bacterium]|nr:methylated-DNA--[protein]-cysteine S-methyltransferase [Candidatus Krumholzibacteria bacterium]